MTKRSHVDDDDGFNCLGAQSIDPSGTENGLSAPSPAKFIQVEEEDAEDDVAESSNTGLLLECDLPPHKSNVQFKSFYEYEQHYNRVHVHNCSECNRVFPSHHYLDLHIAEHHDPIMEARRVRGEKTYGCLVEDCDRLCSTPQKRRLHVIDKHHFPRDYNFWVIKSGTSGRFRPGKEQFSKSASKNTYVLSKRANQHRRNSSSTAITTDGTDSASLGDVAHDVDVDFNEEDEIEDQTIGTASTNHPRRSSKTSARRGQVEILTESMGQMKVEGAKPKIKFGKGQRTGFIR